MKVWSHRGASAYAPENTMEAFKLAVEMGTDGIETDVHLSKDGVLVLMHDEKVNRTTDGEGYIKDLTYQELSKLNANYNKVGYDFCHVPKLEELLQLAKDTGILLNIEIKTDAILYENIEEKVLALVKAYGIENQVMYSSFNHYSLMKMKAMNPNIKIGLLYMCGLYQPWNYANSINADALHPYYPALVLDDYIANAHKHGVMVNAWTINAKEQMIMFKHQGIDGVITDDPKTASMIRDGEF